MFKKSGRILLFLTAFFIIATGFARAESEPNDTRAAANVVTLGTPITGLLASETDVDYYSVTVGSTGILSITFDTPTNNNYSDYFKVTAYDGTGSILGQWETGADKTWTVAAPVAGTYHIAVTSLSNYYNSDQYSLTVSATAGMVLIPAGSFQMGDISESTANPVHTVTLSAFYLDKYEVTKALWNEVYAWATTHGYAFDNTGEGTTASHPVQNVSWYDVVKWLNARSEKVGRTPVYYTDISQQTVYRTGQVNIANEAVNWTADGYRLPTEAEWEYAARGGTTTRFYTGDCITTDQANYNGNYPWTGCPTGQYRHATTVMGSFAANPWGLSDMAGNVWEWTWDWYGSYSSIATTNPQGPALGSNRVVRGGSWGSEASDLRSAFRLEGGATSSELIGFRSAISQPSPSFTLTVLKSGTGSGSITPDSGTITWSGNAGSASYNAGTVVALTATPDDGFTFIGWMGCDSVSGKECTVTMNAARSVTATFNDTTPPSGTIVINGGAGWSNALPVTLSLTCSDAGGCAQMLFSNDNSTWSEAGVYASSTSWTLSSGDGEKTVYAKFRDAAGNWSAPVSDTIMLDTVKPVTTPSIPGGTYNELQTITLSTDTGSSIYYTLDGTDPRTSETRLLYNSSEPISIDATTTLRHYAVDSAGNAGDVSTDTYTIQSFIIDAVDLIKIVQGDTKPVALTLTGAGGFGAEVNLAHAYVGDVPSGASVTLSTYTAVPTLAGTDISLHLAAASDTPPGTYTLRITAAGEGLTETKDIQVTVLPPLEIGSAAAAEGVMGQPYTFSVEVSGGISPYTFTRASGSLPGGLILNADGTISGTLEARGTSSFTIQVQDSDGHTASKDYTIRSYDPDFRMMVLEADSWEVEKSTTTTIIPSDWIRVKVLDDYGQPAIMTEATQIELSSSSTEGRFSLTGDTFIASKPRPSIPSEYYFFDFQYKDTMGGICELKATGIAGYPSESWQAASHAMTVTSPALKTASLTVSALANATYGQGLTVTGMLKDSQTTAPLGYKTVTLTFISPSGSQAVKTVQTLSDGSYSYTATTNIIDTAGSWLLQARFRDTDPAQYNDATASTSFSIAKADTRITLNVDAGSTTPNGQITVSGQLSSFTTVAVDLSGISIILDFVEPDGTTIHSATVVTYDEFGHFTYIYADPFASLGIWSIHARLAGTASLNSSTSETKNLIVATAPGYAILIQGDSAGQYRNNYAASLDDIYKKLLRRSFTDESIYYLSYSEATHDTGVTVDAITSRQNIEYAITTWASDQIAQRGIAPLYIVLMDHGSEGTFYLDPESITPTDLNGWIATLENNIKTNLGQDLTTVIVDGSCYSGSFIPGLSKTGRVVITSSAEDEESAQGPVGQSKTYGEYFVYYLFGKLAAGDNLQDAFKSAAKVTHQLRSCKGSACGSNSLSSQGNTKQHPLLDDNGDGRGSWMNVVGQEDGAVTERLVLGLGTNPPLVSITGAMPTAKLPAGTTSLTAWAKTSDPSKTAASWVEIRKPSYVLPDSGGTGQVIMDLPKVAGVYSTANGRWEYTLSNLDEPGTYTLYYYIMDNNDDVQPPVMGTFYINEAGNQSPADFALIDPPADHEADDAMMVFRWQDAADPEGDAVTYTVRFYADAGGARGDEIKSYELVPQAFFYMNALQEKQNDGVTSLFMTGNSYWWEVEAIDEKGAPTVSASQRFHVVFTNAVTGIITGIIYSDQDYSRIAAATLTANIGGLNVNIPVTKGAFVLSALPGTLALAGAAEGYQSAVVSDVSVQAGKVTTMDIAMAAVALQAYAITSTSGVNGMITPTAMVNHGGNQTFTITPDTNYHVQDVLVDDVSVGAVTSYSFTNVTATHKISATFAINTYSLVVTKIGTGTGSVISTFAGIACGEDCLETYDHGTEITLTEVSGPNSIFTGWMGCDRLDGNDCILSMRANREVTAEFLIGMKGDLDGNLVVDLSDLILAMQIVSSIPLQEGVPIAPIKVADVNNDGRIGTEEMVYILQSITGAR